MDSSAPAIEAQFDLDAHTISRRVSWREFFDKALYDVLVSFRFWRVTGLLVLMFVWSVLLYGIENNYNPIYELGRNLSSAPNFTTVAPVTSIPTELLYIDALFMSGSLWSSTGLQSVDFSLFCRASQILWLIGMMIASLLINTSVPLWLRLGITRFKEGKNVHQRAEYRALVMVSVMIAVYFLFFGLLLSFMFAVFCEYADYIRVIFETADPPVEPFFGGFFLATSAFTNTGFSPFGTSVIPLAHSPGAMIWLSILIFLGNIAFPAVLRGMLGLMGRLGLERRWGLPIDLVRKNPRAYYQMLFPKKYVLFLSVLWIGLCLANFALVMGLEWDGTLIEFSAGEKLVNSIFTTASIRTAGLNVTPLGSWNGALLVFQMVMFVISSNPNVIVMRATRETDTADENHSAKTPNRKSLGKYTSELLINVVAGLTLCWILVLLFEFGNPWIRFPFPVLFEVASAFGTVGLSLGYSTSNASLSGVFTVPSKLVIILLMLIGSHRTLPDNVDSAVRIREIPTGHVAKIPLKNLGLRLSGRRSGKVFLTRANEDFFEHPPVARARGLSQMAAKPLQSSKEQHTPDNPPEDFSTSKEKLLPTSQLPPKPKE